MHDVRNVHLFVTIVVEGGKHRETLLPHVMFVTGLRFRGCVVYKDRVLQHVWTCCVNTWLVWLG